MDNALEHPASIPRLLRWLLRKLLILVSGLKDMGQMKRCLPKPRPVSADHRLRRPLMTKVG
jgi:hypothetical protein